jgi:hypothetical protein
MHIVYGITKWWYQLNTRTNECWMLNDCWAIIYNFNEQSRSITLLVKCKVTLLRGVTLLLLRKHIVFIFISWCKVLPNLAEWWSYGLCSIFDNLVYEYFIHSFTSSWSLLSNTISYPISCLHSLTSSHPRVMSLSWPISGVGQFLGPAWYLHLFERGLLMVTLSPKKLDRNSKALIYSLGMEYL